MCIHSDFGPTVYRTRCLGNCNLYLLIISLSTRSGRKSQKTFTGSDAIKTAWRSNTWRRDVKTAKDEASKSSGESLGVP